MRVCHPAFKIHVLQSTHEESISKNYHEHIPKALPVRSEISHCVKEVAVSAMFTKLPLNSFIRIIISE